MHDFSNVNLERRFLRLLVSDKNFILKAIEKFDVNYLSNKFARWFYKKVIDHFIFYSKLPSKTTLKEFLRNDFLSDPENLESHKAFIKSIIKTKVKHDEFDFILDQLINIEILNSFFKNTDLTINAVTIGNVREEIEKFQLNLEKINKPTRYNVMTRRELNEDIDKLISADKLISESQRGIPSGFDHLDEIVKGWRPAELIMFSAPPGAGKSSILLNCAENVNCQDLSILFITIELSLERFKQRRLALITRMPISKMGELENLTSEEEKLIFFRLLRHRIVIDKKSEFVEWAKKRFKKDFDRRKIFHDAKALFGFKQSKFIILDIPSGISVSKIERLIEETRRSMPIHLVAIDHLNLIDPPMRTKQHWQDTMGVARALELMARKVNLPILSACQLANVKEEGKITTDDVKYAKAIAENADYLFAFRPSEDDELHNRIKLEMPKHRHSEKEDIYLRFYRKIGLITDYNK